MPRTVLPGLLLATPLIASLSGMAFAQHAEGDLAVIDTSIVLEAGDTVPAERGYMWVRENRTRPDSRLIRIRYLRFRSTRRPSGPPILFLAGGPGASGVGLSGLPFFQDLRKAGDVVLVDQRGTAGSEPNLRCPDRWTVPRDRPGTWTDHLESLRRFAAACARYWQGQGVDLTGYNTSESADDFAVLSQGLKAPKIALYGWSYGTHLGFDILRRHPALVHRAVFAGVVGLADLSVQSPSAVHGQLARIDSAMRQDPVAAAKVPDLLALMRAAFQALEAHPVTVVVRGRTGDSVSITYGAFDLQRNIAEGLNYRNNFVRFIQRGFIAAARGDWTVLTPSRSWSFSAMKLAMTCASGIAAEDRDRMQREGADTFLGLGVSFPAAAFCDSVPHRDLGEQFRSHVPSEVPVLFINGTFDRNRVERTEEIRRWYPNSQHLIIDGGFHDESHPEVTARVLAFLQGRPVNLRPIHIPLQFLEVDRW